MPTSVQYILWDHDGLIASRSFQLSTVAAFFVCIAYRGILSSPLPRRAGRQLFGACRVNIIIALGVAPLALNIFGRVSLVGPIATLIGCFLIGFFIIAEILEIFFNCLEALVADYLTELRVTLEVHP